MKYAAIKSCDIANGPGVRVSLFVSGCRHHCKDCFNPETWDFAYGQPFDEAVMEHILAKKLGPWETTRELLSYLDVLVDGPFVVSLKNLNLRFRGSSNQRLIDVPASLKTGAVVLWDERQ